MTDEAREARNAYYRKYRATHKEQQKEIKRRYWERTAREEAEKNAKTAAEER